jgi:hypothetical protein
MDTNMKFANFVVEEKMVKSEETAAAADRQEQQKVPKNCKTSTPTVIFFSLK